VASSLADVSFLAALILLSTYCQRPNRYPRGFRTGFALTEKVTQLAARELAQHPAFKQDADCSSELKRFHKRIGDADF